MNIAQILKEHKPTYSAYVLDKKSRAKLLDLFPPKFEKVICHHITVKFGLSKDDKKPQPAKINVIGYTSDDGLEALVVTVNGKSYRSDGSTYHITLSHGPGRKPVQSNNLVKNGWTPIEEIIPITATPKLL